MSHGIESLELTSRLQPAQADIRIAVAPEGSTKDVELRGKLVGPRCLYASTVEVAYPFRPIPADALDCHAERLNMRVTIPEPSFWEPATPFLYKGHLELWQNGHRTDQRRLQTGLRQLQLGPSGLRLNGRPFFIRGAECSNVSHEHLRALHQSGINTLAVPSENAASSIWDLADQMGFFVLARLHSGNQIQAGLGHPSFMGWIVSPDSRPLPSAGLIGVELHEPWDSRLPHGAHFVICDSPPGETMPFIRRVATRPADGSPFESNLGWILAATLESE
jgi:hypothetical protein